MAKLSHAEPFVRRLQGQLDLLVFAQVNLEVTRGEREDDSFETRWIRRVQTGHAETKQL